jgi:hypothetical protein
MTTPAQFVPPSQLARSARSDEVVAKHKKYLWPSVTNYFQQPLVARRPLCRRHDQRFRKAIAF